MPMVVSRIIVQHFVEHVHGHRYGGIANCMDTELPTELVAFLDIRVNLLRCEECPPAEPRLAFVIHKRPCRGTSESSVRGHLPDRTDAQPVVTVPGFESKFL